MADRTPDPAERLLRLIYGPAETGGPFIEAADIDGDDPTVYRWDPSDDTETREGLSLHDPEAHAVHLALFRWLDGQATDG